MRFLNISIINISLMVFSHKINYLEQKMPIRVKNTLFFVIYWLKYGYVLWFFSKYIKGKSITHNKFRIQSDDSIISRFYGIVYIGFYFIALLIFAWKILLDYTNLFRKDNKKNEKIIYKCFKDKYVKRKQRL